ncbi:hypothetical protein [Candidatus Phytoplasma sacchari]|uniref:Uncharacterized protein n=1 Tax=Candidatus Phytoplasma sacchari TaxID=2609813 RepID=A0ABY7M1A5_9MOLU|nr:hypothetical protein O7R10_00325 [Candidatus Phytoplasma sacchari]
MKENFKIKIFILILSSLLFLGIILFFSTDIFLNKKTKSLQEDEKSVQLKLKNYRKRLQEVEKLINSIESENKNTFDPKKKEILAKLKNPETAHTTIFEVMESSSSYLKQSLMSFDLLIFLTANTDVNESSEKIINYLKDEISHMQNGENDQNKILEIQSIISKLESDNESEKKSEINNIITKLEKEIMAKYKNEYERFKNLKDPDPIKVDLEVEKMIQELELEKERSLSEDDKKELESLKEEKENLVKKINSIS